MIAEVEIHQSRFSKVVGAEPELEQIATGFLFLEGPVWHPYERHLTFSDIAGDCMYRWRPGAGISEYRKPSHKANGNAYDSAGRILTCEHATSRVVRTLLAGGVEVMATHYQGQELNSPNDIIVTHGGSIYFTDPNFGRRPTPTGVGRPQHQPVQGIYRLDPGDLTLTLVADDFENPNGLCFSLDEKRLFINDSPRGHIRVFDVQPDGTLTGGQVWAEVTGAGPGVPDGMKIDSEENLYCAGPGGVYVFDRDASFLGKIHMPEQTANLAWGDDDFRSLYLTASTTLYRIRVQVPGLPAF